MNQPVAGRTVQRSLADLEKAALVVLGEYLFNDAVDSTTVGVICDTVRLCREYADVMNRAASTLANKPDQPAIHFSSVEAHHPIFQAIKLLFNFAYTQAGQDQDRDWDVHTRQEGNERLDRVTNRKTGVCIEELTHGEDVEYHFSIKGEEPLKFVPKVIEPSSSTLLDEAVARNEASLTTSEWSMHRDYEKREMSFRAGVKFALTGELPAVAQVTGEDA